MKIGIDISQMAHEQTGVANSLKNLVENLLRIDKENEYVLFYSSLRKALPKSVLNWQNGNLKIKTFKMPPTLLDFLWNRLHIFPIEWFIGNVDVFLTSDWLEPPTIKAKKATILHDLVIYRFPQEMAAKIVATQKRKLAWVKKESAMIFCVSQATKNDARKILNIEDKRLKVVYSGRN